ncbi:MAG: exonuclease subunit SbcD [Myxococcota bacterium]|jgi:exonuclease SbcD|nr:exonuclease subunit SbcD [Myxococcota bacterium]
MKLLHTADWHLGATLDGATREEDHRHFLGWLAQALRAHEVEVLIVSGDVFDSGAPSAEAQGLYYRFLSDLRGTGLKQVVVVGGNHDSASRLDAPRELLGQLGVHVVGGVEGTLERCLCPLRNDSGQVDLVVLAVPFVHEWRLGFRAGGGDVDTQREAMGAPFRAFYAQLSNLAHERYPDAALVATGHLACVGSAADDAPQEIHLIGSLGGLPSSIFDPRLRYVALGHIHRAYRVGDTNAHYAGSPIALNVKEGRSPRTVSLVELRPDGSVAVERLTIPGTRQVLEVRGGMEEVRSALLGLSWSEAMAPMLKVDVQVDSYQLGIEDAVRRLVEGLRPTPQLVGISQTKARREGSGPVLESAPRLADLRPEQVFALLCEARGESYEELREAFAALLGQEVAP